MKKYRFSISLFLFLSLPLFAQSVDIKDGTSNTLLKINDEGNAGSVILPPLSSITDPAGKLYNLSGTLVWNGSPLGSSTLGGWTSTTSKIYNTTLTDKVGIGTNAPTAGLHVNNNDGILFEGTYESGLIPKEGAGTRMMWYPKKAAFRAGRVNGTQWNDANIGIFSIAMGRNTTASGSYSTAMGYNTTASGSYSTAMGYNTTASGLYSTAMGRNTTASGNHSTAMGLLTTASGSYSTAMGSYVSTNGHTGAFIIGDNSTTTVTNSTTDNQMMMRFVGGYSLLTGGDSFTIDGAGKVGMGKTVINYNSTIGAPQLLLYENGNDYSRLDFQNSNGSSYWTIAALNKTTNADERFNIFNSATGNILSITGDGNVGIGENNPGFKLHIKDNSTSELLMIENTNTGPDTDGMIIKVGATIPTDQADFIIFHNGNGGTVGTIDGNGSNGVRYNTTSDARLKTKIEDYDEALKTVNQIGIKKYERIANPGNEEIGVIAQELQKVYPQAVSGSPDSDVKTDPMMVDYSKLTPLLVKGMQEQQEVIEELKKHNAELENRLNKLESLINGKKFADVSSK